MWDCFPYPKKADILQWLIILWEEFRSDISRNAISASVYVFEPDVDYSAGTESDSNVE